MGFVLDACCPATSPHAKDKVESSAGSNDNINKPDTVEMSCCTWQKIHTVYNTLGSTTAFVPLSLQFLFYLTKNKYLPAVEVLYLVKIFTLYKMNAGCSQSI